MLPDVSLSIHRAARTDRLAEGLGELLAVPLADPFAGELVVVPARGVERWLSQRLADRLGVCAGVTFVSPRSLVAELTGTSQTDPWAPDALVWPLLAVIDASLDEPWAQTLARHLGHFADGEERELRRARRYAVAARLARLFAAYATQRPRLLEDWSAGRATDGAGGRLEEDLLWQPELWRRVTEHVDAPTPAERHADTLARLRAGGDGLGLPSRLSLFGHTRLPVTEIELLQTLAEHRDVHLWLPYPSDALWQAVAGAAVDGPIPRAEDRSHELAGHPLLAGLARDARELAGSLVGAGAVDEFLPTTQPRPESLLGWLQQDLADNAPAPAGRRLGDADRSVQVHACHGPARQVEVLREVVLGLLADDPSLEPRDIVVMCPDIETYAPLINASFGLGEVLDDVAGQHPAHRLRVRLADRSPTQTNPLLAVAAALLDLAGGRATASDVLDLLRAEPIRRRFGFDTESLDTVTDWVRESGVRWALDREHRAPYGLDGLLANTWQFGVDRILTGVALSEDSGAWLDTALPLDDVGSNRIETAGRLAEFVERLRTTVGRLEASTTLGEWIEALIDGVGLLAEVSPADSWQRTQLRRELTRVLTEAGDRASTTMRLADVRALLADHLAGRPTRANFRTGSLTVCTLVPMRSVPHRVVCLLGMDDGVFPRLSATDGDDVLARCPLTGERDIRSEDRQLLLDAVLAAGEHLVITYTGASPYTGQPKPPAVPIGELLDALDRTTDEPVRDRITLEHPLQSFDVRNVEPGRLGMPGPFTFDTVAITAARAAAGGDRRAPSPLVSGQLAAPEPETVVALEDLVAFFQDPVRGFFRALEMSLPAEVEEIQDAMPVDLEPLERWAVGDRMLHDMLRGVHPDHALHAEWRRGTLPPGMLGWRLAKELRDSARELAVRGRELRTTPARSYDIDVALADGRRLVGTVNDVYGSRLVDVGYARLSGKHLLSSWIRLLALSAHDPDHSWTAIRVGRMARGDHPAVRQFRPLDERAVEFLTDLARVHDLGRRAPLALPPRTAFAYANARVTGGDPLRDAERKWTSGNYAGEDADPAVQLAFGVGAPFATLLTEPLPGEECEGETTRLGALARRVYGPMLEFENGAL